MHDRLLRVPVLDAEDTYHDAYERSKKLYEEQLAEVLAHPLTKEGELYYPNALSGLTGPNGYFEPYERNSFYQLDNPYPKNERGTIVVEDFVARVLHDKQKNRILFLDLMGSGAGTEVADCVISSNLIPIRSVSNHIHVEGDSISPKGFAKITEAIQVYIKSYEDDVRPAILHTVFWRPLRAMAYFRKNLYALERMYLELQELYAILPEGGRIYFQAPSDEWLDSFEKILVLSGTSDILRRHPTGSLMTRIVKNSSLPEIPSVESAHFKNELMTICAKKDI